MVDGFGTGAEVPARVAKAARDAALVDPGLVGAAVIDAALVDVSPGEGPTICRGSNPYPPLLWLTLAWTVYWGAFAGLVLSPVPDGFKTAALFVGFLGAIASIPIAASVLAGLFAGVTATYVYPNGLVHTRNRQLSVMAWPQVDTVEVASLRDAGFVCTVVTFDDRRVVVRSAQASGRAAYDRLAAAVVAHGRPVRPRVWRLSRSSSALATARPSRYVAIFAVVAVLGLVGYFGEYLPGPAAFLASLVLLGLAMLAAGVLLGGAVQLGGWTLLAVAFFVAWGVSRDLAPSGPVVVVVGLTVAAEVLAISALGVGMRSLRRSAAAAARRRVATRRGWRFDRSAEVPVGGPLTAYHLVGVPNAATTTTGVNVVRGTQGPFAITIFDRHRPKVHRADPVQTVWLVTLPTALPFVSSTFLAHLLAQERGAPPAGDEALRLVGGLEHASLSDTYFGPRALTELDRIERRTGDVDFARALMTAQVRSVPVGRPWWILGNQLVLVNGFSGVQAASPKEVRMYAEQLLALASAIDGAAVSRFAHEPTSV